MATAIQSLGYLSAFRSLAVDPHVTVARYALDSTVLPLVQDALPFAEQVRRSLIRNRMDTSHSEAITGKTADGLPLAGHRHAHYLATDEDRDGRLDHVTIYAPGGFEAGDVEALGRVTCIFRQGNRPEVRMVLTGLGGREELADVPLFANSRRWRSVTPFALPRFANRGGGKPPRPRDLPEAQLARELRSRGWPERVQLCLQGLLLRENGYECDEGALYFAAAQERVQVPFTDELIARTLELLEAARQTAASGEIPPPLVNSPKCPRCSLVGICLPDEVNLLRSTQCVELEWGMRNVIADTATTESISEVSDTEINLPQAAIRLQEPRRLMPARDDRLAVYVQGQGFSIGLKGEVLEIRDKGKAVSEARLLEISQLNLFGNVQLLAQALRELAAREITILHLSYGGWLTAVTTPPPHKNIELRRRQFEAADDKGCCLQLARAFVAGKIRNSRTLLRRNARELPDGVLHRLAESRRRAERAAALEQLLGIEGTAAREYFAHFARMFKPEAETDAPRFDFEGRNRRPPRDPVNALLSFLYAMLTKEMVVTLVGVGFDPYLGFYHQPRYGRPALALDVMEEFRSLVADSVAMAMINNGEVRRSDFIERAGAVALTESGRKRVLEAYERRLNTLVTHPHFGYAISYRRIFEVQARLLGRFLTGEVAVYLPFCTR